MSGQPDEQGGGRRKSWLCRLGLHTSTFYDTTASNMGTSETPIYYAVTVQRCNKCGAAVTQ